MTARLAVRMYASPQNGQDISIPLFADFSSEEVPYQIYKRSFFGRIVSYFCHCSRIYLFFPGRILSIISMPGVACTSIPPVSLCLTVCALAIPLAVAAAQEEAAAGQAVENGALGMLIIKARVHGRRKIRSQASKGIPANVKDGDHSNPSPVSPSCPLFSLWTGTSAPR